MEIFGEPVYIYQFKINGKMAFEGDLWHLALTYFPCHSSTACPTRRPHHSGPSRT